MSDREGSECAKRSRMIDGTMKPLKSRFSKRRDASDSSKRNICCESPLNGSRLGKFRSDTTTRSSRKHAANALLHQQAVELLLNQISRHLIKRGRRPAASMRSDALQLPSRRSICSLLPFGLLLRPPACETHYFSRLQICFDIMDESMSRQRSDADKMVSFDPVVAPGVDDIFGALDYRLSADYDMEWAPNEGGASPRYDAVVRLETRPPQAPQLQQPEMPIFEGNDKWLELLLRACAPPSELHIHSFRCTKIQSHSYLLHSLRQHAPSEQPSQV